MSHPVLAVHGALGGVGVSVTAAALATALVRAGQQAVLVDLAARASLDILLGCEHRLGLRWPDLGLLRGEVDGSALVARLPEVDGVPLLSRGASLVPPTPEQVSGVLRGLAATTVVVVDCGNPDVPQTSAVALMATRWLMLTRQDPCGASAAFVHGQWWSDRCPEGWLATTSGSRASAAELARHCGLALAGIIPQHERIARAATRGACPASLRPLADWADDVIPRLMDGLS